MIASTTNCCKCSVTVAAAVTAKKLLQQLQQPLLQKVAATVAATVATTIATAAARTVITYVQNGVDIFRQQTGVNVDLSGSGWV